MSVVLDGELIGLDAQGRPAAFQESMARFARAKTGAKPGRLGAKRAPPVWFDSLAPHRAEAPAGTACMPPAGDEGSLRLVTLFFDELEVSAMSGECSERDPVRCLAMEARRVLTRAVKRLEASPAIDNWQKGRERIEAEDLLMHVVGHDPAPGDDVTGKDRRRFEVLVERRAAGEPIPYIKGYAEFRGIELLTKPGVFVPRDSSEFLAECRAVTTRNLWSGDTRA